MKKYFKVAGHVFCFELPEGHPLWEQAGQYEPFRVEEGGPCIFTITLVESLPPMETVKIYGGDEEPGQPQVFLYRSGGNWVFEASPCKGMPVCARVLCNPGFTEGRLQILSQKESLFALNNAAMLLFAFRTACMGTLEMHASVVVNAGRAYLFLAKSGTGKSTHSSLWLKHVPGSTLLNDDNPVVRTYPDGTVTVFGSPWSGKTPCYKNESYPAGAFVKITRSLQNSIRKLDILSSYALLFSSSSGFKGDETMSDGLHESFERVIAGVPCYELECRPDEEAARVCSSEVMEGTE